MKNATHLMVGLLNLLSWLASLFTLVLSVGITPVQKIFDEAENLFFGYIKRLSTSFHDVF